MTLIRLIRRRISRIVSMLLIRSPLRRIALVLGRHLGRLLLLLGRNSGPSTGTTLGWLPWDGWSLVGRRLSGGRGCWRRTLRCSSAVTSGRRRLLVGWRRMGLACGRSRGGLAWGPLLLLGRRWLLGIGWWSLRWGATSDGCGRLIRTGSLSRLTGMGGIAGFMTG